eukprot:scaffold467_cov403-Prasinococcus_capsulatus_cf.AAC.14
MYLGVREFLICNRYPTTQPWTAPPPIPPQRSALALRYCWLRQIELIIDPQQSQRPMLAFGQG